MQRRYRDSDHEENDYDDEVRFQKLRHHRKDDHRGSKKWDREDYYNRDHEYDEDDRR